MVYGHAPLVLMDQRERRAVDQIRDIEAACDPPGERSLAGAKLADQGNHRPGLKRTSDMLTELFSLHRAFGMECRNLLDHPTPRGM